jgi:hypothetical protein
MNHNLKILIFSTEQFKAVADITRPFIKPDCEIIHRGLPPQSDDGEFGTKTFNYISQLTAGYCLDELNKMQDGELLLYCDSDVLLLESPLWFAKQIEDNDFIFQRDFKTPCMGFFVVKASDKTRKLFTKAINRMDGTKNYQEVFNEIYRQFKLKYRFFSTQDVWSYGAENDKVWDGNGLENIQIPQAKAVHANYMIGIQNKVRFLNYVTSKL